MASHFQVINNRTDEVLFSHKSHEACVAFIDREKHKYPNAGLIISVIHMDMGNRA